MDTNSYRRSWACCMKWFADTRPFPIRFFEKSKKGKDGKHMEWKEYKEPKKLHVINPPAAVKRPVMRGF